MKLNLNLNKPDKIKYIFLINERMSSGSLFQSSGAETENICSRSIGLKVKADRIQTERRGWPKRSRR